MSSVKAYSMDGVFQMRKGKGKVLLTKNLVPGTKVYGESLIKDEGVEYRQWDAMKSKLGAAILKGVKETGIKKKSVALYLGAASGTTVSHVSDIVGENGFVFALDFAPRVMRDLVFVAESRKNIAPIYADANRVQDFIGKVSEADAVFMDIAQKDQAEIFIKNVQQFLKKDGVAMLAVKARSVNVAAKPSKVFADVREKLEKYLKVVDFKTLEPFELDHCIFVCRHR